MSSILILAPVTEQNAGILNWGNPPLGPHRLASFLRARNHTVVVYDCNIHPKEDYDKLIRQPFDIVGISVLHDTLPLSLEKFIEIKKHQPPETLLVAGGAESTLNYQDIFDNAPVDIIVTGEGEIPLFKLAEKYPMENIEGIIHRRHGLAIDNNLLWKYYKDIDFTLLNLREYWKQNRIIDPVRAPLENQVRLVTSSHCVKNCSFCSVTQIHKASCGKVIPPAYLSQEQIEVLLDRITKQLPETNVVYFVEDSILPTPQRLDSFCAALKKFHPPLRYRVQTETDKIKGEETIKKLADAGVFHISFGVENCSPRIRRCMNKPQDEQKIEDIIIWCNKNKIIPYYLIILFSPESTIEDLIINYKTLSRWLTDDKVMVSVEPFMMPYRGAPIFNQDFEMGYNFIKLSNGKILKHPYIIYPKDPAVKQLTFDLRDRLPLYIKKMQEDEGHQHQSKDWTGKVIVKLLGNLLREGGYL